MEQPALLEQSFAREKLSTLGTMTPAGESRDHQLVVDALGGETSDLGGRMYRLRLKRNRADYNLNPSGFTLQAARFWLGTASNLIAEIGKLS